MPTVEQIHRVVSEFREPHLAPLRPAYVVMWRPLCLSFLSSHIMSKVKEAQHANSRHPSYPKWFEFIMQETVDVDPFHEVLKEIEQDIMQAERMVELHKWSLREGAALVVINYADMLWEQHLYVRAAPTWGLT
jgi:hypothetical protein